MLLWLLRTGRHSEGAPSPGPEGSWGASGGWRRARWRGGWSSCAPSSSCSRASASRFMKGPTPSSSETSKSVWSVRPPPWELAPVGWSSVGGGTVVEVGERGVVGAEVGAVSAPPAGGVCGEYRSGRASSSAASAAEVASWTVRLKRWQKWRHRRAVSESRSQAQMRCPTCPRAPCARTPHARVPVPSMPALPRVQTRMWWKAALKSWPSLLQEVALGRWADGACPAWCGCLFGSRGPHGGRDGGAGRYLSMLCRYGVDISQA